MSDEEKSAAGDPVETLVADVMKIERRYGHELKGAKSERHGAIREAIETLSKGSA